jgi:hypothetical protein
MMATPHVDTWHHTKGNGPRTMEFASYTPEKPFLHFVQENVHVDQENVHENYRPCKDNLGHTDQLETF